MDYDLLMAIYSQIHDHYIDSCLTVPVTIRINSKEFNIEEFDKIKFAENIYFDHVKLSAKKVESSSWLGGDDYEITMAEEPALKLRKGLKA